MPSTPLRPVTSDRSQAVRTWLMRNPRPKTLRVYSTDKEYDIAIKPGTAWSETATSIMALEPERIEANDDAGVLVRAVQLADLFSKLDQNARAVETQAATVAALQSSDPETQRMLAFASLIAAAHDRATAAIENTVGVAFERMQLICDSLAQQANASTQSANELTVGIRNLLVQQAQEARDETAGTLSPLEQMAANFMSGQQMAAAETAAKSNGKGH